MKTKFTPGPWKIGSYDDDGDLAIVTKKQTIALLDQRMIDSKAMIDDDINKANATLIAAAPELYEMLDKINAAFYTRTSRKEWLVLMEQTKPLLQKARGE